MIQHFQVATARNLVLFYKQMLSTLKCRCQGKGTVEAHSQKGWSWGWAAAPGSHCSQGMMLIHSPSYFCVRQLFSHLLNVLSSPLHVWKESHALALSLGAWKPRLAAAAARGSSVIQAVRWQTWGLFYWLSYLLWIARKEHTVVPCLVNSLRSSSFVTKRKSLHLGIGDQQE